MYEDLEYEVTIPTREKNGAITKNRPEVLENGQESNIVGSRGEGDWLVVEDPTTSADPFYWNSVTEEMRWDLPTEGNE